MDHADGPFSSECLYFLECALFSPTTTTTTGRLANNASPIPPLCITSFSLPSTTTTSSWDLASAEAALFPEPAAVASVCRPLTPPALLPLPISLQISAPMLASNFSSLDNSPASSDTEGADEEEDEEEEEEKEVEEKPRKTLKQKSPSPPPPPPASIDALHPFQLNHVDSHTRNAMREDSVDAKTACFPMRIARAQATYNCSTDKSDRGVVNALVDAFTDGNKLGRPIPPRCEELLQLATDEVENSRHVVVTKQRTESKRIKIITPPSSSSPSDDELSTGGAPPSPKTSYMCRASQDCQKVYTTAEGLRLHIRNHHEMDKKWVCHSNECLSDRKFVRQADLRMHLIRMHSPYRPFPCRVPTCTKSFACYSELKRHIASEEHRDLIDLVRSSNQV